MLEELLCVLDRATVASRQALSTYIKRTAAVAGHSQRNRLQRATIYPPRVSAVMVAKLAAVAVVVRFLRTTTRSDLVAGARLRRCLMDVALQVLSSILGARVGFAMSGFRYEQTTKSFPATLPIRRS